MSLGSWFLVCFFRHLFVGDGEENVGKRKERAKRGERGRLKYSESSAWFLHRLRWVGRGLIGGGVVVV